MPYVITRCWYPLHKAGEPGKKYLEVLEKYPADESLGKELVPVAVTSSKEGIETLSVREVERQKVGDALERERKMMAEFRTIEGFAFEIKTWSTVEEAMEMIGLG